jgi:hypothetical protein
MRSTLVNLSGGTLRDLGLTPNQVWGLSKIDEGWSTALEAALTASRRVDLQHGTNAYLAGCVCKECRQHQRVRMAKNGGSLVPSNQLSEKRSARVEARRLRSLLRSDARRLRLSAAYHAEHGSLDPT